MGESHSLDGGMIINQKSLKSLSRAIALSAGEFSLILLRCNYQQLREKYLEQIQAVNLQNSLAINLETNLETNLEILPEINQTTKLQDIQALNLQDNAETIPLPNQENIQDIVVVSLDVQTISLYSSITDSLNKRIAGTQPKVLMVVGLENIAHLEDLLTSANQVRDEFRNHFPFPIVLWVNDRILTKFIRCAPDFTNWAVTPLSLELSNVELVAFLEEKIAPIISHQEFQQYHIAKDLSRDTQELNFALQDLKKQEYQLQPKLLAKLEFVFGRNAYAQQQLEQALQHYQSSLEFWQNNHNLSKQGLLLAHIALCYCRLAERQQAQKRIHWQSAWRAMEQSLNYLSQTNYSELISQVLSQQGEILQYLQEWDSLQHLAEMAKPLHEICGKKMEMAQDYGFLAMVAIAQSRWQDSIKLSTQALEYLINEFPLSKDHPLVLQGQLLGQLYRLFLVKAHSSLGNTSQAEHNLNIAKKRLDNALKLSDHRADPQHYLDILKQLRKLYFDQGCYLEAFHIKQQQLSVEQLYGFRAFIGARRLQSQPTHNRAFPTLSDIQTTVAAEIRVSSRYQDLQNLINRLNRADHRLIVLHGESGVGKSSLICAGLIPALQEQGVGDRLAVTVVIQIYTSWVKELARAFDLDPSTELPQILNHLKKQDEQHFLTVIIFDQFEEFFFYNTDKSDRNNFFKFLRDCLNISYIKVIISLREDGLHYLLHSEQTLLEPINNNILDRKIRYPLGNFSIADAQAVITTLTERADFALEPDLIHELVAELASKNQEIRPIELQLVGTQIQSENITTLEQYHQSGLKQRLAERFLEQVVQDCGAENEEAAWQVLYFLTAENDIRPLKTRLELIADLESVQVDLNLILEILEKSGLVFLLPEIPLPRYQLVHDYLVNFIRQKKAANTKLQIEDYKQQQISNQETIERLEYALREKALIAELTTAKLGRQDSENKLNQILQQRLTGARLWGLGFLTMAMLAAVFALQASLKETNTQIGAIASSSESLLLSNRKFDALVESLKAGKVLNSFWGNFWGGSVDTNIKVITILQQALVQIRESNRLEGHTDWVMGVVFAPNGQVVATGSKDKTIKLWSPQGQLIKTLTGHQGEVYSVNFSPDSQLLVSGGTDRVVKIWNYGNDNSRNSSNPDPQNNPIEAIGHQDTVSSVVFSPDGQLIASSSWDKTVKLWSREGKLLNTLTGHSNRVLGLDFSPDGKFLVSVGADGKVIFWQKDQKGNFQLLQAWQAPGQDTQKVLTSVRFSPNNQKMAIAGTDGKVSLWQRNPTLRTWGKQPVQSWQASPDWVLSLAFSPDSQVLVTGSADNTIQEWDLQGNSLDIFKGHGNLVRSVNYSPDGNILASGSGDSTVKFWRSNSINQKIVQPEAINSVSFSPEGGAIAPELGSIIATGSADQLVRLWKKSGNGYTLFKTLAGHTEEVNSVVFSHGGQLLATGSDDRTVRLWTSQGEVIRTIVAHNQPVTSLAFSKDDRLIVSGSQDKTAKVWNTEGALIATLVGHEDRVNTVAFSQYGQLIATGSDDQTVKLWTLDGELLRTFVGNNASVNYLAFSADGKFLAVATNKGTIKLWNLDGNLVQTLRGHNGSVNWVGFSPDGLAIASVSEDKTLKFWRLDGNLITTLPGHSAAIFEASFSQTSKLLATAGQDGKIVIWNLDLSSLINQGCSWLGDYQRYNSNAEKDLCDR